MLYLYRRVVFGTLTRADLRGILDLNLREKVIFAPLLLVVLWMGIYPSSFLRPIQVSVDHLVDQVATATAAAGLRRASLP
jgi:NADH-quinone oxidoreductase subunit M